MATPEQEKTERQRLDDTLRKLNEITPESLIRREVLGQALSFESGVPFFERILKLFRDLANCSLDGASYSEGTAFPLGILSGVNQSLRAFKRRDER